MFVCVCVCVCAHIHNYSEKSQEEINFLKGKWIFQNRHLYLYKHKLKKVCKDRR